MRKEWLENDYYAVLGIAKDATDKEIKKAYRKLAQQFHPDTNQGDASAESKFKTINEAYDVLGDAEQRKEYDHAREMGYFVGGPGGQAGGAQYVRVEDLFGGGAGGSPFDLIGGIGDLFSQSGNRRARPGTDLETSVSLTFHEAIAGATRTLSVDGRQVTVKIPKGVGDGTRIRLRGKGGKGSAGAPAGDLYVKVHVASHPIFGRSGKNLEIEVPISFTEATLGADIAVPTLEGKVTLRIPPGTSGGKTFRVSGKGVTDDKGKAGDLLVTVQVAVPSKLSEKQRAALEALRDIDEINPRSHLGV